MQNNLFSSEFARNSKFDKNFVGNILKIEEWLLLSDQFKKYIEKSNISDKSKVQIPKKIHQIWLGEKNIPRICKKWMNTWKELNPQWEYKLWNEKNIKELNVDDLNVYSKKFNPGYRSDILRYVILKKFGGMYVDTDFECIKPLPPNILQYKFIAGTMFGNNPCIGNSILMSAPNFLLMENILRYIKQKDYKNDINHIIKNSGPDTVTREFFNLKKTIQNECLILPSNYFYPYPNFMLNKQIDRYSEIEDVSIGIHHWQMTWMKGNTFNRIKNKLKVILKKNLN
tara:strand:- start:782 stop:1633 length:852 start_codon:yes stop_codon:yes gene_type:complete